MKRAVVVAAVFCAALAQQQPARAQGVINTIAGGTWSFPLAGGPATNVPLGSVGGIAVDRAGNLFLADSGNHVVVRVLTTGALSVVAGLGTPGFADPGGPATSIGLNSPSGMALDPAGNLYISDSGNHRVLKVDLSGRTSAVAGTGRFGFSGDGGPASDAALNFPSGLAMDPRTGNSYIADTNNHRIRKVSASGTITTFAGTGTFGFSGDGGPATSALLFGPRGVAVDTLGNVYIADTNNSRIRKVDLTGRITTLALVSTPFALALGAAGDLYAPEYGGHRIRRVTPTGTITTVAGNGTAGLSGDGGPATSAQVPWPQGVAVDESGNLYIADASFRIRRVDSTRIITTIAGNGLFKSSGDGGLAGRAFLNSPNGVAVDTEGNLYIADTGNHRIRKISRTGTITTVAGIGISGFSVSGPATATLLAAPRAVAVDGMGNLYIADMSNYRVRRVSPEGTISTVAGNGIFTYSGDGGPAISASLSFPASLAVDGARNLYIADASNHRIRKVDPSGTITTVAGNGVSGFSGDGGAATSAMLAFPYGVALDASGNLFIADRNNNRVRMVSPNGRITTVAGSGTFGFSGDGGQATGASLANPYSVALDASGNLYIADTSNARIRKVNPAGTIITAAGSGSRGFSGDGGLSTSATLAFPQGVAVDRDGNFYIADTSNDRIRKVTSAGLTLTVSPVTLSFTGATGAALAPQTISINGAVAGVPWTAAATTQSGGSWLSVSATSGVIPASISVQVGGLPPGTYQGAVTVQAALATPPSITVAVTVNVLAQASISASGITNAASFLTGPVAPGEMVTFFGSGIGPPNLTNLSLNAAGRVDTSIATTQVLFDGVPSPMIYAQANQVSAVVPYGVEGKTSTKVQIQYQGLRSNEATLPVAPSAPGLFTFNASGSGQGAILNQDSSLNRPENPADKGTVVVLFGTGEGQTDPPGVDGKLAAEPLPKPRLPVFVTIGDMNAEVLYAGGAPGLVAGVIQVNARVPQDTPPGNAVPVVLRIGEASSQPGVTLAVR